jgi:hypothetical protein
MFEPDRWIEMFVFRYDRPWPTAEPYAIDVSDPVLALGLIAAASIAITATPLRRVGVALIGASALAICVWALQVYMPIAGTHWGMREAMRTYYDQRSIYGEKIVYFGARQAAAAWAERASTLYEFESFVPQTLHVGQPMTITIQVNKPTDDRIVETEIGMTGTLTAIDGTRLEVTLAPDQHQLLAPIFERAREQAAQEPAVAKRTDELSDQVDALADQFEAASDAERKALGPKLEAARRQLEDSRRLLIEVSESRRRPLRAVDADRLIAWQLYWRGEQFWSGGEIWAFSPSQALPEMKTSFVNTNGVEFQKYLGDRARMPLGRRYFLVGEGGRIPSVRAQLPTARARDTFEVLDNTSNKFGIAAFWL